MKASTALGRLGATSALALASLAQACGVCVEDKVAATYDHAVVQKAAATAQVVVVFCEVAGPFDAARLKAAARQVKGLDAASLRSSKAPSALSFALDTARRSPQDAVAALQRAAPPGTQLHIVRLLAASASPAATPAR